jgi:hypothetical protein
MCVSDKISILEKFVTNEYFLSEVYKNIFINRQPVVNKEIPNERKLQVLSPTIDHSDIEDFETEINKDDFRPYKTSRGFKPMTSRLSAKQLNLSKSEDIISLQF